MEVHRWSVRRSVDDFEEAVRLQRSVVFDSSGSNSCWLRRRIQSAQRRGYATQLLWVDVPLEIAILRNRDRGTSGGQFCPEKVILEKAQAVERSFQEPEMRACQ